MCVSIPATFAIAEIGIPIYVVTCRCVYDTWCRLRVLIRPHSASLKGSYVDIEIRSAVFSRTVPRRACFSWSYCTSTAEFSWWTVTHQDVYHICRWAMRRILSKVVREGRGPASWRTNSPFHRWILDMQRKTRLEPMSGYLLVNFCTPAPQLTASVIWPCVLISKSSVAVVTSSRSYHMRTPHAIFLPSIPRFTVAVTWLLTWSRFHFFLGYVSILYWMHLVPMSTLYTSVARSWSLPVLWTTANENHVQWIRPGWCTVTWHSKVFGRLCSSYGKLQCTWWQACCPMSLVSPASGCQLRAFNRRCFVIQFWDIGDGLFSTGNLICWSWNVCNEVGSFLHIF